MLTTWRNNQIFTCRVSSDSFSSSDAAFGWLLAHHTAAVISVLLAVLVSLVQKCCSWKLPRRSRRQVHVGGRPRGRPEPALSLFVTLPCKLHIDYNDLTVILMSVLYLLVIFIQCKWKLTDRFAMIIWATIYFLMLLLSIGPNTPATLSVQSVLWWTYLTIFADSRLRRVSDLWLKTHCFFWKHSPHYTVFLMTEGVFLF